jgi:hypothetical protein
MKKNQLAFTTSLLLFLALSSSYSMGQTTKVKVIDKSNNPMPFVNMKFVNSHIGITTDF